MTRHMVRPRGLAAVGLLLAGFAIAPWSVGAESQCPTSPPALKYNAGVVTPLASMWYSVGTLSPSDPAIHWFLISDGANMVLWGDGCTHGWYCGDYGFQFDRCMFPPDIPIEAVEVIHQGFGLEAVPFVLEWCNSPSPSCLPS